MQLRPYQTNAKNLIREQFQKGNKRVILCSPTGSGKTVTFASMARDAINNGFVTLIVVDRKELVDQARAKLIDYGLTPSLITAGREVETDKPCYLATVQTLTRRVAPPAEVVIIDEAHKQTFDKVLELDEYQNSFFIGATATALRTGKMTQLSKYWSAMVEPVTINELIAEGYLSEPEYYGAKQDKSGIAIKRGEYDPTGLYNFFDKKVLYAGVVNNYIKYAYNTKALVFNVNVEHSRTMAREFEAHGITAKHVDGSTQKAERAQIIEQHKAGLFRVLCCCDLLTAGYDDPAIDTIIINRATTSLALFLQMCGRGSRVTETKRKFTIIDQGGNIHDLGLWHSDREYSLTHKYKSSAGGVAPIKDCKQCMRLVAMQAKTCKYCGYVFPEQKKKPKEAEFERVKYEDELPNDLKFKSWDSMTLTELERLRVLKKYKTGWILRQILKRSDLTFEMYAKMKNYRPGWVRRQREMYNV